MSKTFRFHTPNTADSDNTTQRLLKRNIKNELKPILLAADPLSFRDERGQWPIEAFSDLPRQSYITLTRKEADLIALANPGIRPPLALELLYPWLPPQVYTENSEKNYAAANSVLKKFSSHFVTPAVYCDQKWNTVCNSVRMKTDTDSRFYAAWHLPVQDCFVLQENRPNRKVVALDFNAMYPSAMQQSFPNPSKIRHVIYEREVASSEMLPMGLYRCKLDGPKSAFIAMYNPFRSFFAGKYLRPSLEEPLSVDLHEFEIEFYQRHFNKIFIVDAVISDSAIYHPLAKEARRLFKRRAHYIANNNKALADREKFLSTLLSSCTHRPNRLNKVFDAHSSAKDFLRNQFGILVDADDPEGLSAAWLRGRKALLVTETSKGIQCQFPDITSGSACFMFNQRIVARGRTILLEMMEKLAVIVPDVELCYANVDSIHFSFPEELLPQVLDALDSRVSSRMGDYKIETIANGGLWLEPGRYWLYAGDLKRFRNRSICHRGQAFTDHSVHVANKKIGDLYIPIKFSTSIERSMTDARSINYDPITGLDRQQLAELRDSEAPTDVLDVLRNNREKDIPRRLKAFRALSSFLENDGAAPS